MEKEPPATGPLVATGPELPFTSQGLQRGLPVQRDRIIIIIKGMKIGKGVRLIFTDKLLVYVKNPKESTKKLLDFVNLARLEDR